MNENTRVIDFNFHTQNDNCTLLDARKHFPSPIKMFKKTFNFHSTFLLKSYILLLSQNCSFLTRSEHKTCSNFILPQHKKKTQRSHAHWEWSSKLCLVHEVHLKEA